MSAAMTPKQRVAARLAGQSVDKIPNLNIVMAFAARQASASYRTYVTDYRVLVEGNLICCEKFGIDMVSAISDPMREAHGFGARVILPEDGVPYCEEPLIRELADIRKLKPIDPCEDVRMADRLLAVERYRSEAGTKYPILGWVEGALAEAADLRGVSTLMMDLFEAPEAVHELLEICTEQSIRFAAAQIAAGADYIGIGDAVASLVGPRHYEEFALPYEQRIIRAVHDAGARAKLHICGNISPLLSLVPESGADIVDVDFMVDFAAANRAFAGKCSACGNFHPVEVLLQGNPETVRQAVRSCTAAGNETAFIAAGCEVPKMTPEPNLLAVHEALLELR